MHALVLYLFAFFTSASSGLLAQSPSQNAGANDGQYLIGVGIGDVTGYVPPLPSTIPCLILPTAQS